MKVDLSQWHPVASSSDLPLRHVYQGQLWGHELAIWRADDGHVNVWENRCLHRGVRLSIGLNEGSELRCLYHGWRYANRTAGCTYIPAHPADAPARTVCNNTYQCIEKYGLVWSAVAPERSFETPVTLTDTAPLTLRAIPINAPSDLVQKFATDYPYGMVTHKSDTSMTLQSGASELQLFFQPVDSGKTIIRGLLIPQPVDPIVALRHHNAMMTALRDKIELAVSGLSPPRAIEVEFKPVAKDLAQMPNINTAGPKVEFRAKVAKKWITSQNVMAFRLEAFSEQFPTFQPGGHIDVSLPNGMLRQYSLTNGPGQTDHYTIGVKRDVASRGGSICLHDDVQEGDVIAISAPHNNFPLRRDAVKTILISGGIGITPLLSMAQALKAQELPFELHIFVQTKADLAFPEILQGLDALTKIYMGLSPRATRNVISGVLANYVAAQHVYICGPGVMLEAAREAATKCGWPDEAVHFEYFKNSKEIDDKTTFEIALSRSALTLQVPAGKTILQILRENGIEVPSSCEQGACGTCLMTVIGGEPDHQDVYLSTKEKASNQKIITCVSRSKSNQLVLDI